MSWKRHQQPPVESNLCKRCRIAEHSIVVRNEPLCADCFCSYVRMKVAKRMESFRVRNNDPTRDRKILLALSLGPCSVTLLDLLSSHLQRQLDKTGRTGFKLCVLHVNRESQSDVSHWENVKNRHPDHQYETNTLADCIAIEGTLSLFPGLAYTDTDAKNMDDGAKIEAINRLLDSLPSPTARSDAIRILTHRLIVHTAKDHGCEAIFWGDTTTKLAERTLAETAKGRGFSLPWVIADGESPQGISHYHPLRDLLSSEILAYVPHIQPPITDCIVPERSKPAVSTKNTTIDDLMQQYFKSVEQEYPSIVANVVRTTAKLQPSSLSEIEQQCELCEMPLEGNGPERSRLCYGCVRTLPMPA